MTDAPQLATARPPTVKVYGAKPAPEPRGASPLLAGIIAGFVAAVLWALLVYLTHYEFGWAAWGVGALVGVAVAKAAREPSRSLGMTAALLAGAALILGKVLIVEFALPPIVRDEILMSHDMMTGIFVIDMIAHRSFSPELQATIDQRRARGDTMPGEEREALAQQLTAEAGARATAARPAERERLVRQYTGGLLSYLGFLPLFRRLFGLMDVLWFGLALTTAWKLPQGRTG